VGVHAVTRCNRWGRLLCSEAARRGGQGWPGGTVSDGGNAKAVEASAAKAEDLGGRSLARVGHMIVSCG
jgi:hypothetical protein